MEEEIKDNQTMADDQVDFCDEEELDPMEILPEEVIMIHNFLKLVFKMRINFLTKNAICCFEGLGSHLWVAELLSRGINQLFQGLHQLGGVAVEQ